MKEVAEVYRKLNLIVMRSRRRLSEICEKHGLTPVQGRLLMLLEPDEPLPMNKLSICMGCDPSNVTGLIERLESGSLIKRTAGREDKRLKMIQLSSKGIKTRKSILKNLHEAESVELDKLTPDEQKIFQAALNKLIAE